MAILTVRQNNHKVQIPFEGTPLLQDLLVSAGFAVPSPCGGRGTCGKCAVQITGAVSEPNTAEQKAGYRLACQTVLLGDAVAELPDETDAQIETVTAQFHGTAMQSCGAAVDIGTTTVALKLFGRDGVCIGEAACMNPQRTVAADVIGRIDAALHGKAETLQMQIRTCIGDLLKRACADAAISEQEVRTLVLTGNTAMLYLLTGQNPQSLSRTPFLADTLFGTRLEQDGRTVFLPPCMNAFVGADITCAVLASGMCDTNATALLCDIGTNGEIALWKNGTLYITSTAAGPAFEGAEISAGCGSIAGAIDRVDAVNGRVYAHTIGDKPAIGICGSGLVDAVAAFLTVEEIDETGAADSEPLFLTANGGKIAITQGDIRALQLAKAAVAAGIETVLRRSETQESEITALYLAGGFGNHLRTESAARIGLIPLSLAKKAVPIGNAALTGACMLLSDETKVAVAERIAAGSVHVELGGSADFNAAFVEHMLF